MKTLALLILTFVSIFALAIKEEFMTPAEARKKWGANQFDVSKFSTGDANTRASMAASLVEKKDLVGTKIQTVRDTFGKQTGYYFSDLIPSYAIGDLSQNRTETWQIVVLPDNSGKLIKEIKIHKKCCYK